MDTEDGTERTWISAVLAKLPYVMGGCGLLAWFALLYFMLRDVL